MLSEPSDGTQLRTRGFSVSPAAAQQLLAQLQQNPGQTLNKQYYLVYFSSLVNLFLACQGAAERAAVPLSAPWSLFRWVRAPVLPLQVERIETMPLALYSAALCGQVIACM